MGRHYNSVLTACRGLLAAATLLFAAGRAEAYPTPVDFDGQLLRWHIKLTDAPVTYEIVADEDQYLIEYRDAIDTAAAMWSAIPTSYFRYTPLEDSSKAQVTLHLASAIEGGDFSAGYALFDEYDGTTPIHCTIFVLIDESIGIRSMQKTFLHELGHCLGLGHTLIPQAIMSYRLDANSFALDVDDRAAASRLYPVDGSKPELPPGCAVGAFALTSNAHSVSSAVLAFFLLLPLFLAGISVTWRSLCSLASHKRSYP